MRASGLLTIVSAIGVAVSAYTVVRGYERSKAILDDLGITLDDIIQDKQKRKEAVKATAKEWLPAVASIAVTEGSIICRESNYIRTSAALSGAIAAVGSQVKKLDKGMMEKLGKEKWQQIKSELAIEDAKDHAKDISKVKKDDTGDVYYDSVTHQFFWSHEINILRAEIELNKNFQTNQGVTVEEYVSYFNSDQIVVNPSDSEWGWYFDDTFDYNASYNDTGYYISLNCQRGSVDGDHDAIIITPSIFPADPTYEWREYNEYAKACKYEALERSDHAA